MDYEDLEDALESNENDPEKAKKIRRVHDKLDALMGEAAEAFLDVEDDITDDVDKETAI